MTQLDYWENCYDKGWKGIALDASMAHPAKFSRGLIFRIVEHAIEEGWVQPGGVILDPFGGVACGALPCLQYGLNYVGVELEEKFVTLARENIALWNARYAAHFPNWGSAQILAGDSRRLAEVVSAAGLVVSSPPYAEAMGNGGAVTERDIARGLHTRKENYGSTPGQLATLPPAPPLPRSPAIISSPPFAGNTGGRGEASRNGIDAALFDRHSGGMKKGTGDDPANLDHLPQGTPPVAIVSSPPYADGATSIPAAGSKMFREWREKQGRSNDKPGYQGLADGYGSTDGQLGAMKPGDISAVIASPPFADSVGSDDPDKRGGLFRDEKRRNDVNLTGTYGETEGQLGAMKAGAVLQGNNTRERYGFVYFLLLSPENSKAALVEIGVSSDVLRLLLLGGVPIFPVNFDNGIQIGNEEISEIWPNLKLSQINKLPIVKKFGEGIFESTLFSPTVALNRAINPASAFEAMRLSQEGFIANRALLFNATFFSESGALNGTKFTLTSLDSGGLGKEFLTALQTDLVRLFSDGDYGTLKGTIFRPLFGITWKGVPSLSAHFASDSNPVDFSGAIETLIGTEFSSPYLESVGLDAELVATIFADNLNHFPKYLTTAPGSIAIIPENIQNYKAVIGSPPFENSLDRGLTDATIRREFARANGISNSEHISPIDLEKIGGRNQPDYGSTDGQIGATQGQTFWEAARLIVEQCALLLPVGGAAIFVVKNYIKNGVEVDFTGQWQQLCEACGFETVHIHRAMLVKENGEQATMAAGHDTTGTTTNLLGEEVTTAGKALANKKNRTERKSFFRRLHERRRPDLAIDFETVLCMRKAA